MPCARHRSIALVATAERTWRCASTRLQVSSSGTAATSPLAREQPLLMVRTAGRVDQGPAPAGAIGKRRAVRRRRHRPPRLSACCLPPAGRRYPSSVGDEARLWSRLPALMASTACPETGRQRRRSLGGDHDEAASHHVDPTVTSDLPGSELPPRVHGHVFEEADARQPIMCKYGADSVEPSQLRQRRVERA